MAWRKARWCAVVALCATGAAHAAASAVDPLEPVKTAIRLKNFSAAAATLQQLASGGNVEAQYLLGVFCLNGVSGPRDPQAARSWFEKAANQGHARAAFSLAALLAAGDPPDSAGAQRWLKRAHELGFTAPQTQAPAPGGPAGLPSSLVPAAQLSDPAVKREAFWLAASSGDVTTLASLADPGLVAATDEFGRGALHRAAEAGAAPVIVLLLRQGAQVNAVDREGITPLMLAAGAGSVEGVDALMAAHADPNVTDHNGNTSLMQAAANGKLATLERLLNAGANVAPRNVQDWSALDFAEVNHATEVTARLREKGQPPCTAVRLRRPARPPRCSARRVTGTSAGPTSRWWRRGTIVPCCRPCLPVARIRMRPPRTVRRP